VLNFEGSVSCVPEEEEEEEDDVVEAGVPTVANGGSGGPELCGAAVTGPEEVKTSDPVEDFTPKDALKTSYDAGFGCILLSRAQGLLSRGWSQETREKRLGGGLSNSCHNKKIKQRECEKR
jgi:hypothetical protein